MGIHLTLPETNIAPENWWLEDSFPFGNTSWQVRTVSSRVRIWGHGCPKTNKTNKLGLVCTLFQCCVIVYYVIVICIEYLSSILIYRHICRTQLTSCFVIRDMFLRVRIWDSILRAQRRKVDLFFGAPQICGSNLRKYEGTINYTRFAMQNHTGTPLDGGSPITGEELKRELSDQHFFFGGAWTDQHDNH